MKHVCVDCGEIIELMGSPVSKLVDLCSTAFFEGKFIAYNPVMSVDAKWINPVLRYLEDFEILVSTEVNKQYIGMSPNMNLCFVDEFRGELCWCQLFHLKTYTDEDYEECGF